MHKREIFVRNLNELCAERRSVAAVCRALGFNRQQFARYLKGEAFPSPHNLRKIAEGFGVPWERLLTAEDINAIPRYSAGALAGRGINTLYNRAFPGDIKRLRGMLGYHHMYFLEPFEPGMVMISLIHIHEQDGKVFTKTVERLKYRGGEAQHLAKYEGVMSMHGTLIFLLEVESTYAGSIVESIFFMPTLKKTDLMTGLSLGVEGETDRRPFATPIAIKFLGANLDIREGLRGCGSMHFNDRRLDPRVRSFFRRHHAVGSIELPLVSSPED